MFTSFLRRYARAPLALGLGSALSAGAAMSSFNENGTALCHGAASSSSRIDRLEAQVERLTGLLSSQLEGVNATSGQGKAVFSWDRALTAAFPEAAKPYEKNMHGGFNEDPKTGIVYTGIPGYGLCAISPDLKSWSLVGTDARLKGNIHGICVFEHEGTTQIAVAQNDDARVLVIALDGVVKQELNMPKGGEFNFDEANMYYSERPIKQCPWGTPHTPAFACTDVTFLDGRLYVVTGYCDGDFVLTASVKDDGNGNSNGNGNGGGGSNGGGGGTFTWGPIAWGGKGDGAGQFQTAHGVFAHDGHIFVANREAHQVLEFTPEGTLVRAMPDIPDTARICNIARAEAHDMFVFNALEPIQHTPGRTAPIYAHSGERLLSTIEPGELGIPVLKHLHHVWPHYVKKNADRAAGGEKGEGGDEEGGDTLYLLVHGWSAGKFAVLKHEPEGKPSARKGWDLSPGGEGQL